MRDLTLEENLILGDLARAFTAFCKLEPAHISDQDEFACAVHQAQNIILARPATETLRS